jgi:hypothetical protein
MHSFGMPSIPQDFRNFKQLMNFCKVTWSYFLGGLVVYGFEHILNASLLPPFMVFVTQIMVCELIFQAVSNCVGFLGWMKFKA